MEQDITIKLAELEQKIDLIYISAEKTRKYMLWTGIITILVIVLPIIAMMFVLPSFMNSYVGSLSGLDL